MVACPKLLGVQLFYMADIQGKLSWLPKITGKSDMLSIAKSDRAEANFFSEPAELRVLSALTNQSPDFLYKILGTEIFKSVEKYKLCLHTMSLNQEVP
jgi:hypothetical protein